MDRDSDRSKMVVRFYCSKHPDTELTFDTNSEQRSSSAYELDMRIRVHPCVKCKQERESIIRAIKTLNELQEEELE